MSDTGTANVISLSWDKGNEQEPGEASVSRSSIIAKCVLELRSRLVLVVSLERQFSKEVNVVEADRERWFTEHEADGSADAWRVVPS